MVTMFGRQQTEGGGLDARIRRLSVGRERVDSSTAQNNAPVAEKTVAPAPASAAAAPLAESNATIEERLLIAREELSARLGAEIRPERRALLTRGDLAKIVDAAVQAYFVRHAMDANPLARRDLITDILQTLITPEAGDAGRGRNQHKAAIEAAKRRSATLCSNAWMSARRPRCASGLRACSLPAGSRSLLAETQDPAEFHRAA